MVVLHRPSELFLPRPLHNLGDLQSVQQEHFVVSLLAPLLVVVVLLLLLLESRGFAVPLRALEKLSEVPVLLIPRHEPRQVHRPQGLLLPFAEVPVRAQSPRPVLHGVVHDH